MATLLPKNVTRVRGSEEWEGLYVNGALVDQNHSIDIWYNISKLSNDTLQFADIEVSQEWLDDAMQLPEDIKDIPEEAVVSRT